MKKKEKSNNMAINVTKISQMMKSKNLLSIEKILQIKKRMYDYNIIIRNHCFKKE